eukprot:SAG11_NODE_28622_length_319_cov_1.595455_2_plen_22_part_01
MVPSAYAQSGRGCPRPLLLIAY